MKNALLIFALALLSQACGTLSSTTYVDPYKSFVLGEGNHTGYRAYVKNVGPVNMEVILVNPDGSITSLGELKPKESADYKVRKNTEVRFKNANARQGIIKIKALGDTNLSMGYEENS